MYRTCCGRWVGIDRLMEEWGGLGAMSEMKIDLVG